MSSLTMNSDLAALQSALGHTFKRPEMLERALTHASTMGRTEHCANREVLVGGSPLALA